MKLYRLTQKKFSESPFSPIGAKLYGGRWNSKGTEALYFSQSESLCSLEVFVHVNNDPAITKLYDLYRIEMPEY
ncbi:RES family NAD+ phosphorylase, partial [Vibrio owensii]